jgi:AraC-like DNA-binding protein
LAARQQLASRETGQDVSRQPGAPAGPEPLFSRRVFDVDSAEKLEASLHPMNGARVLDVGPGVYPFHATGNHCFLPVGELWFSRANTQVTIRYPDDGMLRLRLWQDGSQAVCRGRRTNRVTPRTAVLSTAAADVEFGADFAQVCWRAHKERLQQKLAAMTGKSTHSTIDVEGSLDLSGGQAALLKQVLDCIILAIDSAPAATPKTFLVELEQAFITNLLATATSDGRALVEAPAPKAAPWQVRRAEAHIEANWSKPVTIEELIEVSGTSARSLFRTFKENRGCTPLEFARRLRLQHARRMLEHPDARTTVSEVAFACGFGDLGRFAKEFQRSFGELPSQLLARRRDVLALD